MNSNTRKKSRDSCEYGKECASGKCISGMCLKSPGETCDSSVDCASGKCTDGKCVVNEAMEMKLAAIRSMKRVEPENTGLKHPTNIYIPLGHGAEIVGERHVVPKGCILVVKSHSGDTTQYIDIIKNINVLLNLNNKEFVFDPVSHRKELFSHLASDHQRSIMNINAYSSTAIYREGDTYNNFIYYPFGKLPGSIGTCGMISLKYEPIRTDFKEIYTSNRVNYYANVFIKDTTGNYIYSPYMTDVDIPFYFNESNDSLKCFI